MDPLRLFSAWYDLVTKAFTEHTLGAAVISIAAIGILVVLQKEYRPYRLLTNAGFVLLGWVVAITALPLAMTGAARGWAVLGAAAPWASRISAYLYGIYERHPLLVLAIVGLGATFYFLKQSWPLQISWAPVRAVCTVLVVVLAVHISGPIADLVMDEPIPAAAVKKFKSPETPAREAVAQAIKSGDVRYVSVPFCFDEVAGYPVAEPGKSDARLPADAAVKKLGPSCDDTFGNAAVVRARAYREYAAEYNRLMHEHRKVAEAKVMELKSAEPKAAEPKVTADSTSESKGDAKR